MINFSWYPFFELSVEQLYAALKLREDVFTIEQRCTCSDLDNRDVLAEHLLGMENGQLVAYLRLFPPSNAESLIHFGRVVTAASARSKGYGKALMVELLRHCDEKYPGVPIECSAQFYLKKFYENLGFKASGESYEEAGIVHIAMLRSEPRT